MGVCHRVQATYTLTVSIVLSALVIVKIDGKQYRDFSRRTITPNGFPGSQDPLSGSGLSLLMRVTLTRSPPYPACTTDG